jgi:hypothetical protein
VVPVNRLQTQPILAKRIAVDPTPTRSETGLIFFDEILGDRRLVVITLSKSAPQAGYVATL